MSATETQTTERQINREVSNYTAGNDVRLSLQSDPIPKHLVKQCIEEGEIVSEIGAGMRVALRLDTGADFLKLWVNLKNEEVYRLKSSFERDHRKAEA